jgi:hypothetical protein
VDEFARLPSDERRPYFTEAAARHNLSAQILEKDFWVCWVLRRLFSLSEFKGHLTFKGGTSLSKVYRAIERFSEDVDIAIDRKLLDFGDAHEPEAAGSRKERNRRIERLRGVCQQAIASRLQPQLHREIAASIGDAGEWELTLDSSDPDQQSLLFRYPSALADGLSPYFTRSVKIEMGARSDHFPVEYATITPYLTDEFSDLLPDNVTEVRVLSAARTFWEKTTILHRLYHQPEGKPIPPRMSRHYYDVHQLSLSPAWDEIIASIDLLDRVVEQTIVYFHRAWANYNEARTGNLRLSPPERIHGTLKRDYADMGPMFFGKHPDFDAILARLPELEREINESMS